MAPEDTNKDSTDPRPRCEITKILETEGVCRRPGEVRLDGSLLCVEHAELLRLEDSSEIMLGMIFQIDQWLENADGQADELRVRRVEHQRNELVEQLRFNRTGISLVRDELLKDKNDRMT